MTNKVTALYSSSDSLIYRFQCMTMKKKEYNRTIPLLITFIVLFLTSYLFVFQAYVQPNYQQDNNIYFSLDNSYILLNKDGYYELYIDNAFATILDEESSRKLTQSGITYIETEGN